MRQPGGRVDRRVLAMLPGQSARMRVAAVPAGQALPLSTRPPDRRLRFRTAKVRERREKMDETGSRTEGPGLREGTRQATCYDADALLLPHLTEADFTATRFTPACTKAWFAAHMLQFCANEFPRHQFTQRFHAQLVHVFGHPSHYSRTSFWTEFFRSTAGKVRFIEGMLNPPHRGRQTGVWCDVEAEVTRRLRASGLLIRYRDELTAERAVAGMSPPRPARPRRCRRCAATSPPWAKPGASAARRGRRSTNPRSASRVAGARRCPHERRRREHGPCRHAGAEGAHGRAGQQQRPRAGSAELRQGDERQSE